MRAVDEWLVLGLRLSPTEIDALDMDDYWHWFGVAQRYVQERNKAARG